MRVSIPQAVIGCMQLCGREAAPPQPSKRGFGQETSFSIVFAIIERGLHFHLPRKYGSSPFPARDPNARVQNGQVFAILRRFHVFCTLDRFVHYTGFCIPNQAFPHKKTAARLSLRGRSGRAAVTSPHQAMRFPDSGESPSSFPPHAGIVLPHLFLRQKRNLHNRNHFVSQRTLANIWKISCRKYPS